MAHTSIQEIYSVLEQNNALLVHFSGAPKGSGNVRADHMYPKDLLHVINGHAQGGVSCSTVMPSDNFLGLERNATGCIGVVLGLKHDCSVTYAAPKDIGSIENHSGTREAQPQIVDIATIKESIYSRQKNQYNEWVVRDYFVIGILAVQPFEVMELRTPVFPRDMPEYLIDRTPQPQIIQTTLAQVESCFPNNRIFTFHNGAIFERKSESIQLCEHDAIYQ